MLRVHGPKIINTLKFRLYAPNFSFYRGKRIASCYRREVEEVEKIKCLHKVLSRNGIQTNAVSLWPLQTEAIWEGDVSSALYSCVRGLGSAAGGGWGERASDSLKMLCPK